MRGGIAEYVFISHRDPEARELSDDKGPEVLAGVRDDDQVDAVVPSALRLQNIARLGLLKLRHGLKMFLTNDVLNTLVLKRHPELRAEAVELQV